MRIHLTSVLVDDQAKALRLLHGRARLREEDRRSARRAPMAHRRLAGRPDGAELLLEPDEHPAVRPFKDALVARRDPVHVVRGRRRRAEFERLQQPRRRASRREPPRWAGDDRRARRHLREPHPDRRLDGLLDRSERVACRCPGHGDRLRAPLRADAATPRSAWRPLPSTRRGRSSSRVEPRAVTRVLLGVVAALTALSIAAQVAQLRPRHPARLRPRPARRRDRRAQRADVLHARSRSCSRRCSPARSPLSAQRPQRRAAGRRSAVLFFLAAMDEFITFHELVDEWMKRSSTSAAILHWAWVLPGAAFALAVARRAALVRRASLDRPVRARLVVGAALFLGGALGHRDRRGRGALQRTAGSR